MFGCGARNCRFTWSVGQGAALSATVVLAGPLLIAEGRVERQVEHAEMPVTHLIIRRLIDRSDLLGCLTASGVAVGDSDWVDRLLGRADEVRRPEPGSQRVGPKLPGSRDFR
jgi:error-prone DNA polymerase